MKGNMWLRGPKPPSQFHRWCAAHPFRWAGIIVVGSVVVVAPSTLRYTHGLEWAILGVLVVALALAAMGGASLGRRKIKQFDLRTPDAHH